MPSSYLNGIKKLNEEYEDRLFKLVMNNASEKNGKRVDQGIELLNSDPKNLPTREDVKRFSRLLDMHLKKKKNSQKTQRRPGLISRTAAALMVITVVFCGMMYTVQGFRVQVLNFLISMEPRYTSLKLNDYDDGQSTKELIVNWTNAYVPTYIPDGYEIRNISCSDSIKKIIFAGEDDDSAFVIYAEFGAMNSVAIDTEGASLIKTISINGHAGTLSVKDSVTSVAWSMDDRIFTIQGKIGRDEAVKMAEGVKFTE